jgi:hypothetical protein
MDLPLSPRRSPTGHACPRRKGFSIQWLLILAAIVGTTFLTVLKSSS